MKKITSKSLATVHTDSFNEIKNVNNKIENKSYASNRTKIAGITLIALVITIIILLILTGVTIRAITNTGIIGKAKQAKDDTNYATAAEKVALAINSSYDEDGNRNNELLTENINKIEGLDKKIDNITDDSYVLEITVDGFKFQISKEWIITGEKKQIATLPVNTKSTKAGTKVKVPDNWNSQNVTYINTNDGTEVKTLEKVATVYAVSVGDGKTIPVPEGFFYVGGTLDSGVVISDNELDKNKFAGQEDVPSGAVYDLSTGKTKTEKLTEEEKKQILYGNQFVWIPCQNGEYTKYNWGDSYKDNSWDTSTNSAEKLQVQKYGGFYVGRYEAGTSEITFKNDATLEAPTGTSSWQNDNFTKDKILSGKITSKAGEIPYYHADYETAVTVAENMYKTNSVSTGLMSGTEWDVMVNFMSDEQNKSITNANNNIYYKDIKSECWWGNYNSDNANIKFISGHGRYMIINNGNEQGKFTVADDKFHYGIRTTASTESFKQKNLYDVAGNLHEWTEESTSSNSMYVLRGGSFFRTYSSFPACSRSSWYANCAHTHYGFRPVLYIK